jgi:serine/threonine protein kinase
MNLEAGVSPTWTQSLQTLQESTSKFVGTTEAFNEELEQDPCYTFLGEGANGRTARVCEDHVKSGRNLRCNKCVVMKTGSGVGDYEVAHTKRVLDLIKEKQYGHFFEPHLLQYRYSAELEPGSFALATKYVKPAKYDTLKKRLDQAAQGLAPKLTLLEFLSLFVVVMLTLHFLWTSGNFLHMDLKSDNVLLVPWPSNKGYELLPNFKKGTFKIPKGPVIPVIIDFGASWDGTAPDSEIYTRPEFDGHCYRPIFDIFRWLTELRKQRINGLSQEAQVFVETLFQTIFTGSYRNVPIRPDDFYTSERYLSKYMMLTKQGCDLAHHLKVQSFLDVLKVPMVQAELKRYKFI